MYYYYCPIASRSKYETYLWIFYSYTGLQNSCNSERHMTRHVVSNCPGIPFSINHSCFQKENVASPPQPIPAQVETVVSEISSIEAPEKADLEKKADDDSITEEITELRTAEAVKEHSEWVRSQFNILYAYKNCSCCPYFLHTMAE